MEVIISGNEHVINMVHSLHGSALSERRLKASAFNYVQPAGDGFLIFNTLYNALSRITKIEYAKIYGKKPIGKELAKKLYGQGLLIDEEIDERKLYIDWADQHRQSEQSKVSINITTTLKCNAHCSYCYEKDIRHIDFQPAQRNKLIQFIKSMVRENDSLVLNWFGGEPLMGQDIMDFVTSRLSEDGFDFSSYIITNGALITKKLIDRKFSRWKVKDVQITLDGLAKTYAKRKAYSGQPSGIFNRLLHKIELLAKAGTQVHIRLNIDHDNHEEILDLLPILEEHFGDYPEVSWYPAFLTGIGDNWTADEKTAFVLDMFLRLKNPTKINAAKRMYAQPKSRACMRNDPRSMTVDVKGNIYSCEHLVGRPNKAIGTLSKFDYESNRCRAHVTLRKECQECVFLPKCMGGCAVNLDTGDDPCMIEKYIIQGYLAYMAV